MESIARPITKVGGGGGGGGGVGGSGTTNSHHATERCGFHMPLHYPKYTRAEYDAMPEWKVDCLLAEYGLPVTGDVNQKRKFAMGAFLWAC